jgi:hypothetical protein
MSPDRNESMTTPLSIPLLVQQDIDILLTAYGGRTLPLYAEAEAIRRRWQSANIALEDIIDHILQRARSHSVGFEIDPSQAADALRGPG